MKTGKGDWGGVSWNASKLLCRLTHVDGEFSEIRVEQTGARSNISIKQDLCIRVAYNRKVATGGDNRIVSDPNIEVDNRQKSYM